MPKNSTKASSIDKIARSEAVHDNTAGERVGELTIDPPIEAIQAADRVSEEAIEIIDPSIELVVDRVGEEADENIVEKFVVNSSIEATVDPYIELAVLAAELAVDTSIEAILVAEERVDEFSVDPLIEAIQSRGTTDEEAEGPRFESSPH